MANERLHAAKNAKNDEFYTQYEDIECEMNSYVEYDKNVFRNKTILCPCDDPEWSNFTKYFAANFERFGLKKLISTSYAKSTGNQVTSLFEMNSPKYDANMHCTHGKIFILERDKNTSGRIDCNDIEFDYLNGDGDFHSEEVTKLRDEADIIVTNPPFSLLRDFIEWIMEGNKKFIIIGNKNAITYKEVFPLIKENKMWTGFTSINGGKWMILPKNTEIKSQHAKVKENGDIILNVPGVCWFANIDHGKRHEKLKLMTMADNLKYNQKLRKKLEKDFGEIKYYHYDNYDALEVPFVEAIPSDYTGNMGVPITFMNSFNASQFEIIGMGEDNGSGYSGGVWNGGSKSCLVNGKAMFKRIFIRRKEEI